MNTKDPWKAESSGRPSWSCSRYGEAHMSSAVRVRDPRESVTILIALATAAVLGGCLAAVIFLGVLGVCLNKRFRQQRVVAPDPEAGAAAGDGSLSAV
jgi:hypothetical protein